jgi:hypothetical protein
MKRLETTQERKLTVGNMARAVVLAGSVCLAASGCGEPTTSALEANAKHIVDQDTGCHDFGLPAPFIKDHNAGSVPEVGMLTTFTIGIPIKDYTTHEKGTEEWHTENRDQATNFLDSEFQAKYSRFDGKALEATFPPDIQPEVGTLPSSTSYDLELSEMASMPGTRVVDVHYVADAAMSSDDNETIRVTRGDRLCGQVGFTIEVNGDITNLHVLPPTDQVGKLDVKVGNLGDFPVIG